VQSYSWEQHFLPDSTRYLCTKHSTITVSSDYSDKHGCSLLLIDWSSRLKIILNLLYARYLVYCVCVLHEAKLQNLTTTRNACVVDIFDVVRWSD
jgi:hypothetical protein